MIRRIRHYAHNQAGFSFAELMVVIALISILSAIALPSLLSGMAERRLKSAARGLLSDLQNARLLAVKNNRRVAVAFDTTDSTYRTYFCPDPPLVCPVIPPPNNLLTTVNLADYGGSGKIIGYGVPDDLKLWPPYESLAFDKPVPTTGAIIFEPKGTALLKLENGQRQEIPTTVGANIFLKSQKENVCYAANVNQFGGVKLRRFSGSAWE